MLFYTHHKHLFLPPGIGTANVCLIRVCGEFAGPNLSPDVLPVSPPRTRYTQSYDVVNQSSPNMSLVHPYSYMRSHLCVTEAICVE